MMPTIEQIKHEIFISLRKRIQEPGINDIVVEGVVRVGLTKKYQYHLTAEEFNTIGDELAEGGYFRWNDNGRLALTADGRNTCLGLKQAADHVLPFILY
ncbi:hypothetical protein J7E50_02500 [Pedobacter sp. ISL-68]|uniref:hypothetical protein n=1 Tax=unclassified Pedobacter TaxID=2628915 RepID=UPI001BEB051B|nr:MULTISPECIES: hypothetical protein [unclassified Pedobacter]MBT2560091.1 hypothetical protein [Pedobacter sp. ISL-64]MBT2589070.1 hypothetical protein [Pedobacter sp. ISL-68]